MDCPVTGHVRQIFRTNCSLSSEFTGSLSQLNQLKDLSNEQKIEFIKKLTPKQRINLSPECIHLFYTTLLKTGELKFNKNHFADTLAQLPTIPKLETNIEFSRLITLFEHFYNNHKDLVEVAISNEHELNDVDHVRSGLNTLITISSAAQKYQPKEGRSLEINIEGIEDKDNSIRGIENVISDEKLNSNDDSEEEIELNPPPSHHSEDLSSEDFDVEEEEEDDDTFIFTTQATGAMLGFLLDNVLENDKISPELKAQYFIDIATGGTHCENGQFTQTYKVYLKYLGCVKPEHRILKALHDIRDNICDYLVLTLKKEQRKFSDFDSDESVEDKHDLIEMLGKDIGLLAYKVFEQDPEEAIDFEKLNNYKYIDYLVQIWRNQLKYDDKRVNELLDHFLKAYEKRQELLEKFNNLYNVENSLKIIQDQSKDMELTEWFIQNPPEAFKDNDYFQYIHSNILMGNGSLHIKPEYICLMLENMGVFQVN